MLDSYGALWRRVVSHRRTVDITTTQPAASAWRMSADKIG